MPAKITHKMSAKNKMKSLSESSIRPKNI